MTATITTPKRKGDLRILFWNVKDWSLQDGAPDARRRFDRILDVLRREKPDVALFAEILDPQIKEQLAQALPGHGVFQTNGRNARELVAVFRQAAGRSVTVEQRNEFSNETLTDRTFPLVRVLSKDFNLAVLGLHTPSGSTPEGLARRQRLLGRIGQLNAELARDNIPLVALGDMNTMGNSGTVNSAREIAITTRMLAHRGLTLLAKDKPHTWHGVDYDARYADCSLDQAMISASALGLVRPVGADPHIRVRVIGWPDEPEGEKRDNWVRELSDHAAIVLDIVPQP
jgi:exonuclease III